MPTGTTNTSSRNPARDAMVVGGNPTSLLWKIIGKYLSGLRKLDHVIILKEGFETQLRTPCLSIPCGMCALGMTRQIRDGLLQRGIEPRHVPALQGPDNVA